MIDRLSLKYYAEYFHEMDLNISCVSTQTTKNNFLYGPKRLKAPSHDWEKYQVERQPLGVLQNYDWDNALGIGVILGYNNIAAIDIDGCVDEQIIKYILCYLNLPDDYSWVVKSGSQAGYHIIFRTQLPPREYKRNAYNVRYQPVDNNFGMGEANAYYPLHENELELYGGINIDANSFCKIEFCWKRHIVLPPSIHASSRNYKFLNSLPQSIPAEVDFELLSALQFQLGGNAAVSSSTSGLAVDYHQSLSPNSDNVLIIDTETNGLPLDHNKDFHHTNNWPRLLQLSWMVCKKLNTEPLISYTWHQLFLLKRDTRNIRPFNFDLDQDSTLIHGITKDFLLEAGDELKTVLLDFLDIAAKCDTIIGHNIDFDLNVIKCEMKRCGISETTVLENKSYCTMKNSKDHCEIGEPPYKYPSLSETYNHFFNKQIGIDHNSVFDAFITMKCYNKLKIIIEMGS